MGRYLRACIALCLILSAGEVYARGKLQGYAERGGNTVSTAGMVSTTRVQKSYTNGATGATVTVYLGGTVTPATIYSDAIGTAKANPFTADINGLWSFFANDGDYDVKFSDCSPTCGISSPWTISGLRIVSAGAVFNVVDFGADPAGIANSTTAFVGAHTACPSTGCTILLPSGTYLLDPTWTISKSYVRLVGSGMGNTIIRRRTDVGGDLINVTGTGFAASDLLLSDATSQTNTGVTLHLNNLNDVEISRVWFQNGYTLVLVDHGSNYGFSTCIFEAGRLNEVRGLQASDVRITASAFYTLGVVGSDGLGGAAIKIDHDTLYTYLPNAWKITGNSFENSNIGHFIYVATTTGTSGGVTGGAEGVTIVGNVFNFAGRFNINTYDEIKLEASKYVVITGNSAPATLNIYVGGQRATRYNVNIDANCTKTVVGPNAFNPGSSGIINNLAPDSALSGYWTDFVATINRGAQAGTWTGGTIQSARYKLEGKTMTVEVYVSASSVSATPTYLTIDIPGGFLAAVQVLEPLNCSDNGTAKTGTKQVKAADSKIYFWTAPSASGTWATASSSTYVFFSFQFEVQ